MTRSFLVDRHNCLDTTGARSEHDHAIGATAATKKPQIVASVRDETLFIAFQTWSQSRPTDKVLIVKVPTNVSG